MTEEEKNIAKLPAFPATWKKVNQGLSGLTILDYFAGQVLVGDLITKQVGSDEQEQELTAKYCYDLAEAMVREKMKRELSD